MIYYPLAILHYYFSMSETYTYTGDQRKILFLSIVMMAIVAILVLMITTWTLYKTRVEENANKLEAIVKTQAELIKAVGRFDAQFSADDVAEGARAATLGQLIDALSQYDGFGETGEIVVGQLKGEQIEILLDSGPKGQRLLPKADDKGTPMKRALMGQSGWIIGQDYSGKEVLAAYEAVPELEIGLVAKYELSEVREPFFKAIGFAGMAAIVIIFIGGAMIVHLTNPIIRRLEENQKELAYNERNFRAMVNTIPGTVYQCLMDEHYTMNYISDEIEVLSGYPASDFIGNKHRTFESLTHPDDREHIADTIKQAIDNNESFSIEYRIIDKNDQVHWVYEKGAAVFDEKGTVERLDGTIIDITDRKEAEQQLHSQKQYYEQLIQNFNAPAFVLDAKHHVVIWNKSLEQLTGIKAKEVLGTHDSWRGFYTSARPCLADLVLDESKGNIDELYDSHSTHPFVEGGKRTLNWCTMPTGEKKYFDFDACPIRDEQGNIIAVIEVVKDLTVRKKAEMALNEAKEDAEAATRAKSDFLANMSHEIRTPMNGIMGMVELAMDTDLTQEQREYLQTIDSSAESLLTLIDDILDFSKIEAEKLELDPIDFDLRERLGETLATLAVRAHKKGLELAYDVDTDVPDMLVGDVHRLRQIVVNLVGNALKFTDKGEVVVRVKKVATDADIAELEFSVIDTGIGIPKERLDNIFQAFEQADTSTTRKYGGTGLGLTICSRLSEIMGGRIWVESTEGWGTTFFFTLKMGISELKQEDKAKVIPSELRKLRVLVVDDNKTNRVILEKMLKNWQMEPSQVESAIKGLELLDSGENFDLIISDLHMPEMDGFDFIEEVRHKSSFSSIPVIFLTSSQLSGDRERSSKLGVKEHLIKPVRQSNMFNAIASTIGVKYDDKLSVDEASTVQATNGGLKILLAEDNEVNQKFATRALSKAGHTATVANNGREVLEHLDKESFDLILMDLQMPEMDGFTATTAIRTSSESDYKNIPIIALTAHAMKGDREKCLDTGMNGYVTKPVKSKLLMAEISRVMEESA